MSVVTIQEALSVALEHQGAGRAAEAASIFGNILQVHPDIVPALYFLGMYEWEQGQRESAASRLTRVLELEPNRLEALVNLATFRINLGQIHEACALLLHALRVHPGLSALPAFKVCAEILLNQGRGCADTSPDQARALFDLAMRLSPVHARTLLLTLLNTNDPPVAAIAQAAPPASIDDLARFYVPLFGYGLDIGSGCNLRCAYCCEISSDEEKVERHQRITPVPYEALEAEIELIQRFGVSRVNITGWGETTIKPNWMKVVHTLADRGIPVTMISNFAKRLSEEEIRTLARFSSIVISCDTVNPEVAKRVRSPINMEVMFDNIRALRAIAPETPVLFWNATVSNLMIFELPQWVKAGIELGISQFNINSIIMTPYAQQKGAAIGLQHVSELSEGERERALHSLQEAEALANAHGRRFWIDQGIRGALTGFQEDRHEKGKTSYQPLAEGMSRACFDPWQSLSLGRGKIGICCQMDDLLVDDNSPEALNRGLVSDTLQAIRRGLLEGRPVEECAKCRLRPAIQPEAINAVVRNLYGLFGSPSGVFVNSDANKPPT